MNGPVVLDADGLNTMCRFDMDLAELKNRVSPVILTPHPGEGEQGCWTRWAKRC